MYLRFVYAKPVDGMGAREGFFQAAGELIRDPLAEAATVERAQELRAWFNDNLERPERFSRGTSKANRGFDGKETKGLSWFKPTAKEHLSKAFELMTLLIENGYAIEILKEKRIGYVVYEDDYQVVAEPFADTKT